ncbi:MAG: hypothetical protein ABIQ18_17840 [Umezawaea sp.]
MSEQDLRDSMKQAVWDEPPLDFDPDTFMARAEQLTKRRRALMSVGVATALIIATVATLPAFLAASRDRADTATGVTTTTTGAPTSSTMPWPPNDAPRKNHTYDEDQPYLENMWINVISPGLQRQGAEVGSIGPWSPTYQRVGYVRDGAVSDVLYGAVTYVGSTGPAQLETTIAGVGAWEPSPDTMCAKFKGTGGSCEATKRADGSMVVAAQFGGNKSGYAGERTVYHYRLDGSVVGMTSRPQFVDEKTYETAQVPLTFDQLTDLATIEAIALPH